MDDKELKKKVRSVKLCLMAHPDNVENSEFTDRIADLEAIESYASQQMPSEETLRDICTKFFYWWFNEKGNNTKEGFNKWYNEVYLKSLRQESQTED